VRGALRKVSADPAPRFGQMSDKELNRYAMDNFGFRAV
jgi:hypothetical protein